MKKIISFALALCFVASFSVTAFAADTAITPNDPNKKAVTDISATVLPTYTITIPETVVLGKTATIKADNVLTESNKAINVAIVSTDKTDNAFTVTYGEASIAYSIKNKNKNMNIGDKLSFTNDESEELLFEQVKTDKIYVGDYTGNVIFRISYENITNGL